MIKVLAMTDTGLVRRENQDAYGYMRLGEQVAAVVCDGMGGPQSGDVASKMAVDIFLDNVKRHLNETMLPEQIREMAAFGASVANRAIRATAAEKAECRGMGTTIVSAITCAAGVVISNAGDSRAYLVSREGIRRVSKDHSLVETLVDRGEITEAEARIHPKRNYITRALGAEDTVQIDGHIVPLESGESILLCTDGLVATVSDSEMYEEILRGDDGCLDRLLEISKKRGAADNVTALLLQKL